MAREILPIKVDDLHLTLREQKAIAAYTANGYRGADALIEAGIVAESLRNSPMAKIKSAEFFNRPEVSQAVTRLEQTVLNPYRDSILQQIVQQKRARATYDPATFYFSNGIARPLDEIPVEWRVCIDGVEKQYFGKNADVYVIRYVLADKDRAQKELLEMLKKGEDHSGKELDERRKKLDEVWASAGKALGSGMAKGIDDMINAKIADAQKQLELSDRKIKRGTNVEEAVIAVVQPSQP